MAYRFVRARPKRGRLAELRERLDTGEIEAMERGEVLDDLPGLWERVIDDG